MAYILPLPTKDLRPSYDHPLIACRLFKSEHSQRRLFRETAIREQGCRQFQSYAPGRVQFHELCNDGQTSIWVMDLGPSQVDCPDAAIVVAGWPHSSVLVSPMFTDLHYKWCRSVSKTLVRLPSLSCDSFRVSTVTKDAARYRQKNDQCCTGNSDRCCKSRFHSVRSGRMTNIDQFRVLE